MLATENLPEPRGRVLFITYFYPPVSATGSVRTKNVAKYLTALGWEVTIVTPDLKSRNPDANDSTHCLEPTSREWPSMFSTRHRLQFLMPAHTMAGPHSRRVSPGGLGRWLARKLDIQPDIGWALPAYCTYRLIRPETVDVILVSGGPFASFLLAAMLGRRLNKPYVTDYRDLWTDNPHGTGNPSPWSSWLEALVLRRAAGVVVVSPGMATTLAAKVAADKIRVVTNGYDPVEMAAVKPAAHDHFAIVYAGRFYPPKRGAASIMAALARLELTEGATSANWLFHYYGPHSVHVAEEATRHGVSQRVRVHGEVVREAALSAVRGAGVSVVMTSVGDVDDSPTRGILTAKLFDALGLGTPLLLIAPSSSDAAALFGEISHEGHYVSTDTDGIASYLAKLIGGHRPARRGGPVYSWPELATQMGGALRSAIEAHGQEAAYLAPRSQGRV